MPRIFSGTPTAPIRVPLPQKPRISLPVSYSEERFGDLVRLVQGCRACPRMEGRRRVLSELNGRPGVAVLFVAEAPGRFGADRTGVPIHGDATGDTFEKLLGSVGWDRGDVFVTNAVLCNPRGPGGNNDKPNRDELTACSFHLGSTIRVVEPKVVVSLGVSALEALNLIEPHSLVLRAAVATAVSWYGRILFPLYHQSPRALIHRNLLVQKIDFRKLAEFARSL